MDALDPTAENFGYVLLRFSLHRSEPGVPRELNIPSEGLDELGITTQQTIDRDDNYRQRAHRMRKAAGFMNFTNKARTFTSHTDS
jgi:hypothetical protein